MSPCRYDLSGLPKLLGSWGCPPLQLEKICSLVVLSILVILLEFHVQRMMQKPVPVSLTSYAPGNEAVHNLLLHLQAATMPALFPLVTRLSTIILPHSQAATMPSFFPLATRLSTIILLHSQAAIYKACSLTPGNKAIHYILLLPQAATMPTHVEIGRIPPAPSSSLPLVSESLPTLAELDHAPAHGRSDSLPAMACKPPQGAEPGKKMCSRAYEQQRNKTPAV